MAKRQINQPKSRRQLLQSQNHGKRDSSDSGKQSLSGTRKKVSAATTTSDASIVSSPYAAALAEFLQCVEEAVLDVRENGHGGRLPPDCLGDTASERFDKAYEALREFLKPLRTRRRFVLPPSLSYLPGVIVTETALQAWMLVLNPVGQLYGEVWFLDSEEYVEIKRRAVIEAVTVWDDEYGAVHDLELELPTSQTNATSLRKRLLGLTPTQRRIYEVVDDTPRRGDDIADLACCEVFTARRYLPQLIRLGLIKKCPAGYYRDE